MLYVLNVLKKEQILGPKSLPEDRLQCLYLLTVHLMLECFLSVD